MTEGATNSLLMALRVEDGLSYRAIAKVAARLGRPMSPYQVRYLLYAAGVPKNPNMARGGKHG